ncbi:hypothetical protein WR25_20225 [Diploscapter pachys]|uniref:Uncharacterized protein n=1 Tax=Diploscapter pachys TaxID=2018661 RepID=A0A2A2LQT7_9BILA|nr:hypothetical protein WR25_20225 [Diploscapter pachys]
MDEPAGSSQMGGASSGNAAAGGSGAGLTGGNSNKPSPATQNTGQNPLDEAVDSSVESSSLDEGPLNEDIPIPATTLGNAIDDLMTRWVQIFSNVSISPPILPASTVDHVKEVAEICQKHFRNANMEVCAELNRISTQWELEHPQDAFEDELNDLNAATDRQKVLLKHAKEVMEKLTDKYFAAYPDAGKQHLT